MSADPKFQHNVHMGLGEAIRRLVRVEILHARGIHANETLIAESKLITEALNVQYQLDLGFDCDMDGVPDSVEIFAKSAETACCRILPMEDRSKKVKGKSRAKAKSEPEAAPAPVLAVVPEPEPEPAPVAEEPAPKKTRGARKGLLSGLFGGGE